MEDHENSTYSGDTWRLRNFSQFHLGEELSTFCYRHLSFRLKGDLIKGIDLSQSKYYTSQRVRKFTNISHVKWKSILLSGWTLLHFNNHDERKWWTASDSKVRFCCNNWKAQKAIDNRDVNACSLSWILYAWWFTNRFKLESFGRKSW